MQPLYLNLVLKPQEPVQLLILYLPKSNVYIFNNWCSEKYIFCWLKMFLQEVKYSFCGSSNALTFQPNAIHPNTDFKTIFLQNSA